MENSESSNKNIVQEQYSQPSDQTTDSDQTMLTEITEAAKLGQVVIVGDFSHSYTY